MIVAQYVKSLGMLRDRNALVDSQANGLGATRQVYPSAPLDPVDPPPITGSKPDWMSGDRGRMILSSTPDYTITTLSHIMVFPADRPGMYLFVLFFYFIFIHGLTGMPNYTICKGNIRFHHQPKYLFVCIANCGGKLSASQRWTKNCFVVEVKWSFQGYTMLYGLCFLYFTHSSFVFYA